MIGSVLGNRYEIIEKIGEGGMSEVFKAKCRVLNRYVAIKVLKKEFSTDNEFVEKFKLEATAAAALSCNNIVSIYDVGSQDGINYIVMELVTGKTLKQVIRDRTRLSFNETLDKGMQIARALECAHKNHIIHRDIKPQNILVTEDGIVKVTDFGIAKAMNSATITNTTKIIGSAHYFSPEQAKGSVVDFRTDIYSLGIVLYEMIVGKVPYDADSPVSVALKHIQESVVPPIQLNPYIPESMNKLILKAMEKDPNKRYQTIKEMISDMQMIQFNQNTDINVSSMDDTGDFTRIMDPITEEQLGKTNIHTPVNNLDKVKNEDYDEDEDIEYLDDDVEDDKDQDKDERKKIKIIKWSIIALVVLIVGIISTFSIKMIGLKGKKDVVVPTIIGLNKDEAKNKIEALGLNFVIEGEEENEKPKDTIIKSNPSEGEKVKKDSDVKVIISKGKGKEIVLKNFVGINFEEVKEMIKGEKLQVGNVTEQYNDIVPKGQVISQNPEPDTKVMENSSVDFVVSNGPESKSTRVPDLTNKTIQEAQTLLQGANLKLGNATTVPTPKKELDGKIINQSFEKNSEVKQGTYVNVTYYKFDLSLEFKNKK